MKQFFKRISEEVLILIAGILIALAVNGYINTQREEDFLRNSLRLIAEEHKDNAERLSLTIKHQEKLLANFQNAAENTKSSVYNIVLESGGFKSSPINNTAWNKLLSKNIELVDYQIIKILTEIDNRITAINALITRLGDTGYANAFKTDPQTKLIMISLLNDVIQSENLLMQKYDMFDDIIGEKVNGVK